ncbi:hydrolase of the alpha/beta superfamily protein (macronuclear) [Tetrahymena thermophila SB210]|uniref:Hydrolase of the alpha/beta superfamily protein n=1 Tax=Tetrahymena thermophila (strain SB210) TaxID=312017 RepID=I7MLK6_TETTS|nr:hydrolase of the alpha/beta superfamily protein [Tetrahymena thermophila SB210]EAS02602.2 hydrolase of the alpha/beta superfamily protein [Tetrahymena thermophila SB210]|eukprot:XP_001022847.2 hydrolase of the alpha/beta superfamily protein [Tetrahymena thermophila SB210]
MGSILNIVDKNLFPAPEPSYNFQTFTGDAYIEFVNSQYEQNKENTHQIPLLVIPYYENGILNDKYLVYFHGNAEDIGLSYQFLFSMQMILKMNIIAVEYPGYGIYKSRKTTAECIKSDSLTAYNYILKRFKTREQNITILGRSIGSGPASYVASKQTPKALVLISAYISIKHLIGHHICNCISFFISERFNNIECMNSVSSPVLLIHGMQDTLIPPNNSQMLQQRLKSQNKIVTGIYHKHMTHNDFDERNDISIKIKQFLETI